MKQYPPYVFRFFIDPGHAWLEVPLELVFRMNCADKISAYSYMKDGYAYLEEDIDVEIFLSTLTNDEYALEYFHLKYDAPIRDYPKFWCAWGISNTQEKMK